MRKSLVNGFIMNKNKLLNFYNECMICQNTKKDCPGILKDIKNGVPPRGFHFENPNVKFLVVGKNPGHPLPKEREVYKGQNGNEMVIRHLNLEKYIDDLNGNERKIMKKSTVFHKNLFSYLSTIFNINNNEKEIYNVVAHTNLVKCSTEKEQGKLNKKTIDTCFITHFLKELDIFKPKVIIALGREVEKYLKKREEIDIPIIYLKHPSYYYRKEIEKKELNKIKNKLNSIVKDSNL